MTSHTPQPAPEPASETGHQHAAGTSNADTCACPDYSRAAATRRGFLRGIAGTSLAAAGAATAVFGDTITTTSYAHATDATDTSARNVLVVVSLRGAADGLSLVVPHHDPAYYKARPNIAVPKAQLLAADAYFGLHPAFSPLLGMWSAGKMAAVHATGLPAPNRSHFSAMEEIEDADPGSAERIGWLNRLIGRETGAGVEGIAFTGAVPSTLVSGPTPVLVAPNADSVKLAGPDWPEGITRRRSSLELAWASSTGPLARGFRDAVDTVDVFAPARATPAGTGYPATDLAHALRDAARTIKADVGAEAITVDHGSWDHHVWIGNLNDGNLVSKARELAGALAAFFTDLGTHADRVTVVTVSEFGRRVAENSNQGLDHGHGNVMFLLGAGVRGGKYYGTWPGLATGTDADLLVTTDYRHVLSEVIAARFGTATGVFPGFSARHLGVMTP